MLILETSWELLNEIIFRMIKTYYFVLHKLNYTSPQGQ